MTSYEILRKCGWSPEEASRISGTPVPRDDTPAGMNEAKYAKDTLPTAEERKTERLMRGHSVSSRYSAIEGMKGTNGDCHSRKTVWRRHKFGKGNVGRKGYMASGFDENGRPR